MSGPVSPDQKFPTHTIHIPQMPSNMLLYRTLFHTQAHICNTKFVADVNSVISSVSNGKITGNFCSHAFMGAWKGWGYIGGAVHRRLFTHIYLNACMEREKDAYW
jgi:hypothetical protein